MYYRNKNSTHKNGNINNRHIIQGKNKRVNEKHRYSEIMY